MRKLCPFRKIENESQIYKTDERFQECYKEQCMAYLELENGAYGCGLIVKPIIHQEVEII